MPNFWNNFDKQSLIPTYWFNKSNDLWRSARILWEAINNKESGAAFCGAQYLMLMGMSIEALIKAHCVAQKLEDKDIAHSHDLTKLAKIAGLKMQKDENNILTILTGYVTWEGRYPTPKREAQFNHHNKTYNQVAINQSKIGELIVEYHNDQLDFDNIHKIWSRLSDDYLTKYNETPDGHWL
ncbi:hypothetical protein A9266_02475 [Vibrio tasmaniensis]|nr:hypothetical protein A9266_02475 [Vibrio tasmaniensis]